MTDMTHLSVLDGAFLHLETPEMPMHVGSIAILTPPPGGTDAWFNTLKAHVQGRMHLAPVFTRKLAPMPFDLANPVWITDNDIDLDYHIRRTVLPPPGTVAQIEALAARLHSSLLDRSRPLWETYVIEGLADGRVGFYFKVHHAAVDGQASIEIMNALYDTTPEPRRVRQPRHQRSDRYQLGVAELLVAMLGNQWRTVVQLARLVPPIARAAWRGLKSSAAEGREGILSALAPPKLQLAPPTPFNASITNQRAFAGVSLPLAEVKAIGKAHGASINDMVLWLCSTALREYLADSRELPAKSLVAGVPVSLRAEGDATSNNQVSGALIELGTHLADPAERLKLIVDGTKAMKAQFGSSGALLPKDFPSFGAPWWLGGLVSLYGHSGLADKLRLSNVTISNVPGPRVPLYLAGAQLEAIYPLSIVVHGVALNITVESYTGQLCFGLLACRRAAPDVHELAEDLEHAMHALRQLAPADTAAEAPAPAAPKRPRRRPKLTIVEPAAKKTRAPRRGIAA